VAIWRPRLKKWRSGIEAVISNFKLDAACTVVNGRAESILMLQGFDGALIAYNIRSGITSLLLPKLLPKLSVAAA